MADVSELESAIAAGVADIELTPGVYDLSGLSSTVHLGHSVRMRGGPGGESVLTGFEVKRTPLFTVGDAAVLILQDLTFQDCGALIDITSTGPDCRLECRRLRCTGPGPLLLARQPPSDEMRDLTVAIEDCKIDCASKSKAVHLVGVGLQRFLMQRCKVTNCEKASVQIGEAGDDLWQPRRRGITIRDCEFRGVLDRDTDPGESHAIFLRACQDVVLEDLRISEVNSRSGRTLDTESIYTKARNVMVRNCQIHNGGRAGITIKGVAYIPGKTDPEHHRCGDDVVITGCTITASEEHEAVGLTEGVYLDCGGRVTVHNNTIRGVRIGIRIQQRGRTGGYMILDNDIQDTQRGIYYREVDGDVLVARNHFRNCRAPHTGPAMHKATLPDRPSRALGTPGRSRE